MFIIYIVCGVLSCAMLFLCVIYVKVAACGDNICVHGGGACGDNICARWRVCPPSYIIIIMCYTERY